MINQSLLRTYETENVHVITSCSNDERKLPKHTYAHTHSHRAFHSLELLALSTVKKKLDQLATL